MTVITELQKARIGEKVEDDDRNIPYYLQKFRLYETRSKFYMVGRDKSDAFWRILKIDRVDPYVLTIEEDSTIYTEGEVHDLLNRINEGNRSTGGCKLRTMCFGIIGFLKLLATFYIYVITKRKKIGAIGAHAIYTVDEYEMIPLRYFTGRANMALRKDDDRYKDILRNLDITKDFYFSYSYHVMRSLQKNLYEGLTGPVLYEKMFVWNEFLTRGIRHQLKNTLWTVALVHGFFKQVNLSIDGREFKLTLIARRSRHYAGTRYLKRGVNEKGRVANDVETEQILFEDAPEGSPVRISSVVQNRGSIPLFWSQETSRLNLRPKIILSKKNKSYEATRFHFDNLVERYGNPIIILNLIKTREKKPRESILRTEFVNAIEFINKDLPEESRLKFVHWDLQKRSRSKNVLAQLGKLAANALNLTGFFYCEVTPELASKGYHEKNHARLSSAQTHCDDEIDDPDNSERGPAQQNDDTIGNRKVKSPIFQNGVLRTNCIDCLDRTNVAQYTYGLAAIGHQLHALGFIDVPRVDVSSPLGDSLMRLYEAMGDTLALQYGGSPAHNKIFSERRGQSKAVTQSQELIRTIQRYYSNAYMDAQKQDAINLFLGHFQPQEGKPALWELNSDQHYTVGTHSFGGAIKRLSIKRSFSDGNMLGESETPVSDTNVWQKKLSNFNALERTPETITEFSECTPEISRSKTTISQSRYTPSIASSKLFMDMQTDQIYFDEDALNCSNFVDFDWLSSSGNSCEDELHERAALINSSGMSSENVVSELTSETAPIIRENGSNIKEPASTEAKESYERFLNSNIQNEFSERFARWVSFGEALCIPNPT
ncbi:hypothetical protein ACHQM5_029562 [Ranunculus cassubicifolius]